MRGGLAAKLGALLLVSLLCTGWLFTRIGSFQLARRGWSRSRIPWWVVE